MRSTQAYRLAEGQFAKEAMDEIVDCITKPKFIQRLIIILAGYDKDISRLMTINPGFTSRFPEELEFTGLSPNDCLQLLTQLLQKRKAKLQSKVKTFNMHALESQRSEFGRQIMDRFSMLAQTANWANARDVQTLGKAIFGGALRSMQNRELSISETLILSKVEGMISERTSRATELSAPKNPITDVLQRQAFNRQPAHPVLTATSDPPVALETTEEKKDAHPPPASGSLLDTAPRDGGVSDDTWQQLEQDKQAEKELKLLYQTLAKNENTAEKELQELPEPPEDDSDPDDEAKREHERRRLEQLRRRARLEELRREREDREKARREEQRIKQKLRQMGVCVAGFRWIKQASGYRCAGGSHYISNEALGI